MSRMTEEERQKATDNNTKLVRDATNVASHMGPHAQAIAKGIKAADSLTHGRVSRGIGNGLTNLANAVPGGKGLQDKLNKAAGLGDNSEGANNSGNPEGPNTGSNAIKKSLANKGRNLMNWRSKKKKKKDSDSNPLKPGGSQQNEEEKKSEEEQNESETTVGGSSRIKKFAKKLMLSITGSMLLTALVLSFILSAFGINVAKAFPSVGANSYGTSQHQPIYEEGTSERKAEEAYYKKLNSTVENYSKNHKEEINKSYIHTVLIYRELGIIPFDTNEEQEERKIDFKELSSRIDDVVELMTPSEEDKKIDYAKYGEFYNNLRYSDFMKEYYKEAIDKGVNIDDIMNGIFDLAEDIKDIEFDDETVVTNETTVSVPTTTVTKTSTETSSKTETKTTTTTMSVGDYIASSIYAVTDNVKSSETVKAYAVAYSTNIVANNKSLTITSSNASMNNETCSVTKGCSYSNDGKLFEGPGERNSKNQTYYNGSYYYRRPLTTEEQQALNNSITSVEGKVLTNKDGTYPSLDISAINITKNSEKYDDILKGTYGDLKFKDIGEDSYFPNGDYGTVKKQTAVYFYDQKDYSGYKFCNSNSNTIGGSGCGVTAMAIVLSTYKDSKIYDPIKMNEWATSAFSSKQCGGGKTGTLFSFFKNAASKLGYDTLTVSKSNTSSLKLVTRALSKGNLVVANMGQGTFTNGGHYIVLGGVDPNTKMVYVYDPNNRSNKTNSKRKSGNGWYSFEKVIVKEARMFFIIRGNV